MIVLTARLILYLISRLQRVEIHFIDGRGLNFFAKKRAAYSLLSKQPDAIRLTTSEYLIQ